MKKIIAILVMLVVLAGVVIGALYARSLHESKAAEHYLNQMVEQYMQEASEHENTKG